MVSAKSTGMKVNKDLTSNDAVISSLATVYCLIFCAKTELFWTVFAQKNQGTYHCHGSFGNSCLAAYFFHLVRALKIINPHHGN